MSFFDEDDEPRRQRARPRRGAVRWRAVADQQTLMTRRIVAGVVGRARPRAARDRRQVCRNSQHESALKDYNREVSTIATESAQQVGAQFFQLLGQRPASRRRTCRRRSRASASRPSSSSSRPQGLSVPERHDGAQQSLLIALELRRDGLD